MSKTIFLLSILLYSLLLYSCIGKHTSSAQRAYIQTEKSIVSATGLDTIEIDLLQSMIQWKGTKMRGSGQHVGEVQLQSAFLLAEHDLLEGGSFVIDMTTIGVTDIPKHEPVPIGNLNNHLKSADFFDVEPFPFSSFEITAVSQLTTDSIDVTGNLTIKDVTRSIRFKALKDEHFFSSTFTIDRFLWNVGYKGSWVDKTLVDSDIELTISLKTK